MCHVIFPQLTVQCYHDYMPNCNRPTPCEVMRGSATVDHQFAYFTPAGSYSVFSYEWNTKQLKPLSQCQYRDSALVVIEGQLTAVGGESESGYSKKRMTLQWGKWVEEYPPMKTARSHPAVVSATDGDYIIVIGGSVHGGWTATVELFQVKTRQWYKLTNLPQPLTYPSATICGNQVHVIGSGEEIGYSLQALPCLDKPWKIPVIIWKPLPRLPVKYSTAATLSGELIIIGGWRGGSPVNSIHQLVEGQWVEIGSMASSRRYCLSVSPSPDRVIIVGGDGAQIDVEECVVS